MRIFIGFTDVANITAAYAKGFRLLGHQVFSVTWSKSYFYPDSEYELVIDERSAGVVRNNRIISYLRMFLQMTKLVKALRCDVFIMYAPAVLPSNIYYAILRVLGKKIITAFWGSDVRYWYAFAEQMTVLGCAAEMQPVFKYMKDRSGGSYWDKLRTIQVAEKYSHLILSQPDCAQLQSRPYMRANLPIDLSLYDFHVPGRKRPLILHAPSVPEAKGSDVVLKVIQELRDEGLDFEFRLIEKMPNAELRLLLTESDIVVDELYAATVGGLSAEAMATGNAVLVRYMEDFSKVPPGCPAINVNQFNLKEHLRDIILNVEKRKQLAHQGRPYVEFANDHIRICRDILNWLAEKDNLQYDFHPTFFQRLQIPEEILKAEKEQSRNNRFDFFKTLLQTGTTRKKNGSKAS